MRPLSPEGSEVLRRICAAHAALPFPVDKADRLRPQNLCRAEHKLAIAELLDAGVLELRQKVWGERLYQIPAEKLPLIQQSFFPYEPQSAADSQIRITAEAGPGLAADLFRALLYTGREGLPLTGKGSIHKKNLSRLAEQLSFRGEQLIGLSVSPALDGPYPLHAAVAIDLMLALGLIERAGTAYSLQPAVLEKWLRLGEDRMNTILYESVLNRYGNARPAEQHLRVLISAPLFVPGEWFVLQEVLEWMTASGLAAAGPGGGSLEAASLSWLQGLASFGWCETGELRSGAPCFRWTAAKPQLSSGAPQALLLQDEDASMLMVQPDFEVLVPPGVPYTVRWTLACCAELRQWEGMWVFRLTREKFAAAADLGLAADEIISWLNRLAAGGLPQGVKQSLEQWARGMGRTVLAEVIVLACRHAEDAEVIAGHPRLQQSLSRLGPLHFAVSPGEVARVRQELAAAGMAPPRLIEGQQDADTPRIPLYLGKEDAAADVYKAPDSGPDCRLYGAGAEFHPGTSVSPESMEELLPGVAGVPAMWSRDWRVYHTTTAQKIMEQAVEWGIRVQIVLGDERVDLIPERITRNPWRVSGYILRAGENDAEEAKLSAADWKEMKLMIPAGCRNSSSA
ncbi:helicase-associated domain-containing protein [Paenibacillus albidus]|uniref:helicase-associated domain-containing protein n=1 Tax=Paenibacillus albidus TaxID=2041023 RepID=UPI001BE5BE40|nr:helicase-associated domain-containing protein [Paenibacillus albidus]MBT2287789.1 helicase-associated domain-containing protein [Paenibacillus albidus]